jgi:hypothetical protein
VKSPSGYGHPRARAETRQFSLLEGRQTDLVGELDRFDGQVRERWEWRVFNLQAQPMDPEAPTLRGMFEVSE